MTTLTFTVDGVDYTTVQEQAKNRCDMCAGHGSPTLCRTLSSAYPCDLNKLIFIKKPEVEVKLTHEIVKTVLDTYVLNHKIPPYEPYEVEQNKSCIDAIVAEHDRIIAAKNVVNDPDYKKYLELKEKFKNV